MTQFCITIILCICVITSQANNAFVEWTWISGDNSANTSARYGTKTTPDSRNIPGPRYHAFIGYDSLTEEVWLFGGYGYGQSQLISGYFNDVWRYQMNVSIWTWMAGRSDPNRIGEHLTKGYANPDSTPGGRRGAAGFYDSSKQELWIFGGFGYPSTSTSTPGDLNDLWRYHAKSNNNTWTWMSGDKSSNQTGIYGQKGVAAACNVPGARRNAIGWYDSLRDEFWLFGGQTDGSGTLEMFNDLWRYRVNDSTWTWMSGSETTNQPGVYGEKGISSAANVPGARASAVGGYDSLRQEFWLFGGYGYGYYDARAGYLNDLWIYHMNNNTWTWVSGSNTTNQQGVYESKGIPDSYNVPGARRDAVAWFDSTTRDFWLFGGDVVVNPNPLVTALFNDVWRYRVQDSKWTWISGSHLPNRPGVYGEKGNASAEYAPGARFGAAGWYDSLRKEFVLFGGSGYSKFENETGYLNDVWKATLKGIELVPDIVLCPPLHQPINNTCIPLIHCSIDDDICSLECDSLLSATNTCVIEDDIIVNGSVSVNGSIVETDVLTFVGVINVTGNVVVTETTVKVSIGTVLHVGKCLMLEEGSQILVVVDGMNSHYSAHNVLATYDSTCSSRLKEQVRIELASSSYDECRDGRPTIQEEEDGESGRTRLTLLFVFDETNECYGSESELDIVAIAVAVPIAVLVIVVVVVVMAVPKLRKKVFPFANRKS